ncbi:MAG: patatin-like phospholipase family protein [Hyphomicrobiales bacterium]
MTSKTEDIPDLLAELPPRIRKQVRDLAEHLVLPAGKTLFDMGDQGTALYLVVAGSLGVYLPGADGCNRLIALIWPGETVGEMSLISGLPRSATVIAIRDTEMLRLTKGKFDRLVAAEPKLAQGLNKLLVHRLRQVSSGVTTHLEPKTVAFLPATRGDDALNLANAMADGLREQGKSVQIITDRQIGKTSKWFTETESRNDFLFMCAEKEHAGWWGLCTRQADRVLIVANASDAQMSDLPPELLRQRAEHQLLDLVLLHSPDTTQPSGTRNWRNKLPVNRHFHIRHGNKDDLARIIRLVMGHSVGLVLSGGGARAYAHVGVIKALHEAGVPVDFIGGTSMGGIVGACLASGWPPDELEAKVREAFLLSNPLSDYTLPFVSLVKGDIVVKRLREFFGDIEIPDLWWPYFCVSSNLTNGHIEVHENGNLVDALLASIALPGVLPPQIGDHGVLADGGILNNMPVDVMRGRHRGPIAAVDVARDHALTPSDLRRETAAPLFQRIKHPAIVSILMRAGTISHQEANRERSSIADIVFQPPLVDVDIRDWKAFDETVRIGYEHASKVLEEHSHALKVPRRVAMT